MLLLSIAIAAESLLCNDDWFWLHMSVVLGAKLMTNDEMRDHTFQMLSPRWFERWKERNQIRFGLGAWMPAVAQSAESPGSKQSHHRQIVFSIPPRYSHRMQCLVSNHSYAFPARNTETWLCVWSS